MIFRVSLLSIKLPSNFRLKAFLERSNFSPIVLSALGNFRLHYKASMRENEAIKNLKFDSDHSVLPPLAADRTKPSGERVNEKSMARAHLPSSGERQTNGIVDNLRSRAVQIFKIDKIQLARHDRGPCLRC